MANNKNKSKSNKTNLPEESEGAKPVPVHSEEVDLESKIGAESIPVLQTDGEPRPDGNDALTVDVDSSPISYPLKIIYCGNCGLPPEYCEYFPDYEKCRQWLETNLPNQLGEVSLGSTNEDDLKKGRQKRGGKGLVKTKKTEKKGPTRICLSRAPRGKKKSVTVITGLGSAGIDLKVAAKYFGTKFACGSSVTGDDEIVIQGDVKDDLFDLLPEKWPEIDEDCIEDLGDQKR